jgi:hypothetical protein
LNQLNLYAPVSLMVPCPIGLARTQADTFLRGNPAFTPTISASIQTVYGDVSLVSPAGSQTAHFALSRQNAEETNLSAWLNN